MTRPTIAVIGSYAPSLVLFRGPLIAELVKRGYRVVAMAPAISSGVKDHLEGLGAEAREVQMVNNSMNPAATLRSLRSLQRSIGDVAPDAVLTYTIKPVTLGSIAAARLRVPKIIALVTGLGFAFTEGGGFKRRLSRAAAAFLYRHAMTKATTALFQNPDDLRFFKEQGLLRGKDGTVVNGSGIDLAQYAPAPLPEGPRFLMIARLIGDKGVREYAAAAAALKADYPEARFELAGWFDESPDAISREELDSWAGTIDYLGKLDDVRPAIARARVYVLPSRYREGTPRSSLEAMAMGRPVITTDWVGCRETVEDGRNGFLVPVGSVERLRQAMERMIVEPDLAARMGRESRRMAEDKFDVHLVNRQIIEAAGL